MKYKAYKFNFSRELKIEVSDIGKFSRKNLILLIKSLFPDPSRCQVLLNENISVQDLAPNPRQKVYEGMNILIRPVGSSQVMAHYSCLSLDQR